MLKGVNLLLGLIFLALISFSFTKLVSYLRGSALYTGRTEADVWLDQNELGDYKQLFKDKG